MSVDWFTVAAQIVNFFILVWLLKKFLYKPILTAMDNRQKKIEAELQSAATLALTAEQEKKNYIVLQEEARARSKEELAQARRDADILRQKLFQEVKEEAEAARVHLQDELLRERATFLNQASNQVAGQFLRLAHTAFRDLADANLETSIVSRFCKRLSSSELDHDFFRTSHHNETLQVFTAFALSTLSQKEIKETLYLRLGAQPPIQFLLDPSLLAGILIASNNHKLEWNMHQYLDNFQDELKRVLAKGKHKLC